MLPPTATGILLLSLAFSLLLSLLLNSVCAVEPPQYSKEEKIRLDPQPDKDKGYTVKDVTNDWKEYMPEIRALAEAAGQDAYTDAELHAMGLKEGETSTGVLLVAALSNTENALYGAALFLQPSRNPGKLPGDRGEECSEQEKEAFKGSTLSNMYYMGMIVFDEAFRRRNIFARLIDGAAKLLVRREKEAFRGVYTYQPAANISGLVAMLGAVETSGARLWGTTTAPVRRISELSSGERGKKVRKMRAVRSAAANTRVDAPKFSHGKEEDRIWVLDDYMQGTSDLDYYVWVLENGVLSNTAATQTKPVNALSINVEFRGVKTAEVGERAAAIALVYSNKGGNGEGLLRHDEKFSALGAFVGNQLIAAAVLTKDGDRGEYELRGVATSCDYSSIQPVLEKRLLHSHLLPWLQWKHSPRVLPSIYVEAVFSSVRGRSMYTLYSMLPHLMQLGFHASLLSVGSHSVELGDRKVGKEGKEEGERIKDAVSIARKGDYSAAAWSEALAEKGLSAKSREELHSTLGGTTNPEERSSLTLYNGARLNSRGVYRPTLKLDDRTIAKVIGVQTANIAYPEQCTVNIYIKYRAKGSTSSVLSTEYGRLSTLPGPVEASSMGEFTEHCPSGRGEWPVICVDVRLPEQWIVFRRKEHRNSSDTVFEYYLLRVDNREVPSRLEVLRLEFDRNWRNPTVHRGIFARREHGTDGKYGLVEVRGVLQDALLPTIPMDGVRVRTRRVEGPFKLMQISGGKEKRGHGVNVEFGAGGSEKYYNAWIDERGWPRLDTDHKLQAVGSVWRL